MIRFGLSLITLLALMLAGAYGYYKFYLIAPPGSVETVSFTTDDGVVLTGELYLPAGEGPHAAAVLMHGSGPEPVRYYEFEAAHYPKNGMAILIWDKRGVERSEGDFESAVLERFALDGLAGLDFLKEHPAIDSDRLGAVGISEGAWLTPYMAYHDPDIRFIINRNASSFSWGETVDYEIRQSLTEDSLDPDGIDSVLELRWMLWTYYRDAHVAEDRLDARREQIEAFIDEAEGTDWYTASPYQLLEYDPEIYQAITDFVFFDPQIYLRQIDTPIYVTYAENDEAVDTYSSREALQRIVEERDGILVTRIAPNRRHNFGALSEWWNLGYPADYPDASVNWAFDIMKEN